ncbi:hypothetical protein ACFL2Q_13445 [Thermodesulfobacteriota bacterium]
MAEKEELAVSGKKRRALPDGNPSGDNPEGLIEPMTGRGGHGFHVPTQMPSGDRPLMA